NGDVAFTGDSNIGVAQTGIDDDGEVEITLNRDLDLDSVTTGNSVLNDDGLTVDDGGGNVASYAATGSEITDGTNTTSTSADGINVTDGTTTSVIGADSIGTGNVAISGLNNDITGLSNTDLSGNDFAQAGRAATEEQLDIVNQTANEGWNLTAQSADSSNVAPGDTVDLSNTDGNIQIANDDNDVTFDLADNLTADSVTTGNSVLNDDGLTITGGPSITASGGIDANDQVISSVGAGEVSGTSTDAVNGSQLFGSVDSINSAIGGNAVVNADGTITTSDVGNTGEDTVHDAIDSVNTAANAGW
ncbi:hypothetical protein QT230_20770, partial [Halomonas sp. SpR8]|nr:hypothetical protein [Halomonas sp. SpR8]